LIKVSSTQSHT